MAGWALAAYAAFLLVAFGARTAIQRRRTGRSGFVRPPTGAAWLAEALLAAGVGLSLWAPALDFLGVLDAVEPLDVTALDATGFALLASALAVCLTAQAQMGRSWRAGVDPEARTELITTGLFSIVRNPFYVGLMLAASGVACIVPNVVAVAAVPLTIVGSHLVVRQSEEPYLRRVHGEHYIAYAARTGRFVPRVR
ncbi:MAG: methyltransferase family protein [Acidimicrobiia bacterium]